MDVLIDDTSKLHKHSNLPMLCGNMDGFKRTEIGPFLDTFPAQLSGFLRPALRSSSLS